MSDELALGALARRPRAGRTVPDRVAVTGGTTVTPHADIERLRVDLLRRSARVHADRADRRRAAKDIDKAVRLVGEPVPADLLLERATIYAASLSTSPRSSPPQQLEVDGRAPCQARQQTDRPDGRVQAARCPLGRWTRSDLT